MTRGSWFHKQRRSAAPRKDIPTGLWVKCPHCGDILFARDVERNLSVCPKCEYHHRLSARSRLDMLVDEGSFEEFDSQVISCDPLEFPGYREKLEHARQETQMTDALLNGYAKIGGRPILISITDFSFIGGSMGSVVGEKLARIMERSVDERLPLALITANGGGARMYEGLLSLMQMAKTSAAASKMHQNAIPYIVILTDPTMAGVYASYASLGDIILAEPGALIGFAGKRVGNQDLGAKLPDDFQTSEFQFRCGMIDQIVHRKELRCTLSSVLSLIQKDSSDVL